jgi:hypothetical protein
MTRLSFLLASRTELHALGSTIFEIVTSSQPHGKVDETNGLSRNGFGRTNIQASCKDVVLGDIILKCWKGGFTPAKEVAQEIEDKSK